MSRPSSRNFPLLSQAQVLKQMAARGGRGGRGGGVAADAGATADQQVEADGPDAPPPAAASGRRGSAARRAAATARRGVSAGARAYPTRQCAGARRSGPRHAHSVRGDFKNKGEKVEPGFLSALQPGPPIVEPKGFLFVPQRRKALALVADVAGESAARARDGEPHLAGAFRRGHRAHAQRFRPAGRAADASRTARLAGGGVRRAADGASSRCTG